MLGTEGTLETADYELCGLTKSITIKWMYFASQYSACLGIDQDQLHLISSFKVLPIAGGCIKWNCFIGTNQWEKVQKNYCTCT